MKVLRWVVPVDDESHSIGSGDVAMVAARQSVPFRDPAHAVEVWTIEPHEPMPLRRVRVFGTGHEVPEHATFIGSTFDADTDRLVWHVFQVSAS
jgi:hypothetical protein